MKTIAQEDLIGSVADALQFISYYHPADYIAALGEAVRDRERRLSDLDQRIGEMRARLEAMDGSDAAASAAETAQAALTDIRAAGETYLRLRVADLLLR